jgi:arylsulfatase A-like enzyme
MDKPNILQIMSDQHRFDCLGVNRHPLLKTPNLDRLAAEGVNFTNAFTPCPMCVPARCSFLTGQWPSQHGVVFNFDGETFKRLAPGIPTVSAALSAAGYRTAQIGRWHVDPKKSPAEFGFDHFQGDWDYHAWRAEQGLPPLPKMPACWAGERDPVEEKQSRLAWSADNAIEELEAAAAEDRPFFLRWHTVEPHLPCFPTEPYASMYNPADIEPWPGFGDPFENKPDIQRRMLATWGVNGWTWKEWAPVVARYLGVITQLDHELGRVLAALKGLGLEKNTLVVYTSDHGDMCGSHGMVDKHFVMYDDVVRVPLILRHPDLPAGTVRDDFVSNAIDLPSTFCAASGIEPPETFAGKNIFEPTGRADIFTTYSGNQFGAYSQRMVRDRRWKFIWNLTDLSELYDLATDPGESCNRIADAAAAPELARLKQRMIIWMESIGDPMLNLFTRRQLEG